ncbi:MAG: polysaccharide deacetylase family protein [Ignavibacteriae bacterium]|nr:polysaccharide deacetylase family protein [Ignavibacteriota bacterium]
MKLQVGLMNCSPGWSGLLKQIGLPFRIISSNFENVEFSAIITGDVLDEASIERIQSYAKSGGSLLLSSRSFKQLSGVEAQTKTISYLFPRQDSLFSEIGLLDIFSECMIPSNANDLHSVDGKPTCFIGKWNGANVFVLPFDAGCLFTENRTTDKSFYSPYPRLPFERVSLVSKHSLRKFVTTSLEYLFHQRNLPFVHLSHYPGINQSLFAFRIDTDYAGGDEINKLYALSRKYQVPFTWFVDVKSQQDILSSFAEMENQEIGIHCFEHQTYEEYQANYDNILKAKQLFESNNINAKGFAAPFGKWNQELGQAIRDLGFEYSSEFSYDYDNYPSYPFFGNEESTVLQVPIHPISIGTLKRLGYSDEIMIKYFQFVIEQKYRAREPIILYHHPKDGHEKVLECIFEHIKHLDISTVRFIDYATWWKKRVAQQLNIDLHEHVLSMYCSDENTNDRIRITRKNETESMCEVQSLIPLDELRWQLTPEVHPFPNNYLRIRKYNPWISFIHLQDYIFSKLSSKY